MAQKVRLMAHDTSPPSHRVTGPPPGRLSRLAYLSDSFMMRRRWLSQRRRRRRRRCTCLGHRSTCSAPPGRLYLYLAERLRYDVAGKISTQESFRVCRRPPENGAPAVTCALALSHS